MQLIKTGGSADAYYSASGVCRGTSEGFLAAACFRIAAAGNGTVCGTWGLTNGWRLTYTANSPESVVTVQLELGGITTTTLYSMQSATGRLIQCAFGCMRIAGDLQTFLLVNGNVVASDLVAAPAGFLPASTAFNLGDDVQDNTFNNVLEFQGVGFSNIEQFAGDYDAALRVASGSWRAVVQTEAMYLATTYAASGSATTMPWDTAWDSQSAVDSGVLLYSSDGRPLVSDTWKPRAGSVPLTLQAPGAGRVSSLRSVLWTQPTELVLPPIVATWRESTPFIQASWRRNYGNQDSGGRIFSAVDAIAPASKTYPHAQYWAKAVSLARAPLANADNIGWEAARHTALACNDKHYLDLQSGPASYSWNHCLNFNIYSSGTTLQIAGTEDPLPPDYLQLLDFVAANMLFTRNTTSSGVSIPGGLPPVGATCVIGWNYDRATTTGKVFLNGVLSGIATSMSGDQAVMAKESWGSVFPAARGIDALQYERLFCAGALTDPEMATVAANLLADYPP